MKQATLAPATTLGARLALLAAVAACRGPAAPPPASQPPATSEGAHTAGPATPPGPPGVRARAPGSLRELTSAWTDEHELLDPSLTVEWATAEEDAGLAALVAGSADLAIARRSLRPDESDALKRRAGGHDPRTLVVAHEVACVVVNEKNPLDVIDLAALREILGEGGSRNDWLVRGLDARQPSGPRPIVRVHSAAEVGVQRLIADLGLGGLQPTKIGSLETSTSADVLAMVAASPEAIGYLGSCAPAGGTKILRIAHAPGSPGVAPDDNAVREGRYPLARPIQVHLSGAPAGQPSRFVDWLLSESGQQVVKRAGFVPAARFATP